MSWGKADSWDPEQMEAWEHDECLLMQEMGDDYYKLHRRYDQDSEEEDPFEVERRIEWEDPQEYNMTGVQEDSGQSQTAKELDESREVETIRKSRSTKEVDKMAEGGDIEQVIEDYFEVKKDEEDDKEEGSGKKPVPKVTMWLSWWKKQ